MTDPEAWPPALGGLVRQLRAVHAADPAACGPELEDLELAARRRSGAQAGGRPLEALPAELAALALAADPWLRAVAWRLLRLRGAAALYAVAGADRAVQAALARGAEGGGGPLEQYEALALVRAWLRHGAAAVPPLPGAVLAGVVALARGGGSRTHWQAFQLLRLLAARDPEGLARHGGLGPLLRAAAGVGVDKGLARPQYKAMLEAGALAASKVLAHPGARHVAGLPPWVALDLLLSQILDQGFGAPAEAEAEAEGEAEAGAAEAAEGEADVLSGEAVVGLLNLMKTWPGLIAWMSASANAAHRTVGGKRARATSGVEILVETFRASDRPAVRRLLLLAFCRMLSLPPHPSIAERLDAGFLEREPPLPSGAFHTVHTAVLLCGLMKAGLVGALIEATQAKREPLAAAFLLTQLGDLVKVLLPEEFTARIRHAVHASSDNWERDTDFGCSELHNLGIHTKVIAAAELLGPAGMHTALAKVSQFEKIASVDAGAAPSGAPWGAEGGDPGAAGGAAAQQMLRSFSMLGAEALAATIAETKLLEHRSKDWHRWNWDAICAWAKGPLRTAAGFECAAKTKALKRLAAFFCKRAAAVPRRHKAAALIATCGAHFVDALLQTPAGQRFLTNSPEGDEYDLLKTVLRALQLEASQGARLGGRLFHPLAVAETLSVETLRMLARAWSTKEGHALLGRFGLSDALESAFRLDRGDLHWSVLSALDFQACLASAEGRGLLAQAAAAEFRTTRLMCLARCKDLVAAAPDNPTVCDEFSDSSPAWLPHLVDLLLRRLEQAGGEDAEIAVALIKLVSAKGYSHVVAERVADVAALQANPEYDAVLALLLQTDKGLQALEGGEWLRKQLEEWGRDECCRAFVRQLEDASAKLFKPERLGGAPGRPNSFADALEAEVRALRDASRPVHLFAALAATKGGCRFLADRELLPPVVAALRAVEAPLFRRRAAALALGQIGGSSDFGLRTLKALDCVDDLFEMAEFCAHLSLRGSCILALNLVAQNASFHERLLRERWAVKELDPSALVGCRWLAVPVDCTRILHVPSPNFMALIKGWLRRHRKAKLPPADEPQGTAPPPEGGPDVVLEAVRRLCDPVASAKDAALEALTELRTADPDLFRSRELFGRLCVPFETHRLDLEARRFVWDLFAEVGEWR